MQLAIELPDELGNELLQQDNVTQFVQEAVKSRLLEVRQSNTQRNTFIKTNEQEHLPITRSLIGILKDANLGINDYKQHLEDKYL
jgi:hypothetical protein